GKNWGLEVGPELAAHRAGRMLRVVDVHVERARVSGDCPDLGLRRTRAALPLERRAERDVDGPRSAGAALVDVGRVARAVDLRDREVPADLAGRKLERDFRPAAVRRRRRGDLVRAAKLSGEMA